MELKNAFNFLIDLKHNNERNWFKENENRYKLAKNEFECYIDALIPELKRIDNSIDVELSKSCMFRIYRDVRFSKNKEPYKTNFGAFIAKGGRKSSFAGFYVHFEPDVSFLGGGIYMPPSPNLKAIRTEIFNDPDRYKAILNNKKFNSVFGGVYGEKLKSAPRGFPKDFADIELLKNKHYAVTKEVKNDFWFDNSVLKNTLKIFKIQNEFNQYLNQIINKITVTF